MGNYCFKSGTCFAPTRPDLDLRSEIMWKVNDDENNIEQKIIDFEAAVNCYCETNGKRRWRKLSFSISRISSKFNSRMKATTIFLQNIFDWLQSPVETFGSFMLRRKRKAALRRVLIVYSIVHVCG
jgi:hypothetical protein